MQSSVLEISTEAFLTTKTFSGNINKNFRRSRAIIALSSFKCDNKKAESLAFKLLVMFQTFPSLVLHKSHNKNLEEYLLKQMFKGFNNKQVEVTLT